MPYDSPEKQRAWREANKGRAKNWACRSQEQQRAYNHDFRRRHPGTYLLMSARQRARKIGLEFSITKKDIVIPTHCPILGIELRQHLGSGGFTGPTDHSPSVDRIDNRKGYVPGNIMIVSFRANRMKQSATPDELRRLADFYADQEGRVGGSV